MTSDSIWFSKNIELFTIVGWWLWFRFGPTPWARSATTCRAAESWGRGMWQVSHSQLSTLTVCRYVCQL